MAKFIKCGRTYINIDAIRKINVLDVSEGVEKFCTISIEISENKNETIFGAKYKNSTRAYFAISKALETDDGVFEFYNDMGE